MPKKRFTSAREKKETHSRCGGGRIYHIQKTNMRRARYSGLREKRALPWEVFINTFMTKRIFFSAPSPRIEKTGGSAGVQIPLRVLGGGNDFSGQLNQTGEILADIIFENPQLFHSLVFDDSASSDYLQRIDDYLQKDRERGILRDDVDEKMAAYLYTTIEYLAYQYCRHHDITYREDNQVISRMMDILFFGIYGKSRREKRSRAENREGIDGSLYEAGCRPLSACESERSSLAG